MAIETKWPSVSPRLFTTDGDTTGTINVASAKGFKVKQIVAISATGMPDLNVQVKRVLSPTSFIVGPIPTKQGQQLLSVRQDLTGYTVAAGAFVYAQEQDKNRIKPDDIMQAVYRQEPGTTIGVEVDDQFGVPIDSVVDDKGINRLAVDGNFHADVDVQVDVDIDGVYDPVTNPDPDNVGIVAFERSNPTDDTKQTQRVTAIRGTNDTDTVSQDVSLHDNQGNAYTHVNPLPVSTSYEKFFALINGSPWLKLGNYDEVVPSVVGANLLLSYKEDGAVIGEALITNYASETGWTLSLTTFINDDDGSKLLDDDSTPLNLD